MRSPGLIPHIPGFDVEVYLVLDDFGRVGRAYREVDENEADKATLIRNMLAALTGWQRSPRGLIHEALRRFQRSAKATTPLYRPIANIRWTASQLLHHSEVARRSAWQSRPRP